LVLGSKKRQMNNSIRIDGKDNVVVALADLAKGSSVVLENQTVILKNDIPRGHKIATASLKNGDHVIKYGFPIGHAIADIAEGEHVHAHNLKTNLEGLLNYEYHPSLNEVKFPARNLTFKGFRRSNGDVGIRNELWIVPTVGCVNGIGERMIQAFKSEIGQLEIDSIEIFKHNYGCSQLGDDHENTIKILRDIVLHPNAAGVLVLGLGCENNQPDKFEEYLGDYDKSRIKFLVTQKVQDEHEEGLKILRDLYAVAKTDTREDISISELKIGLKCGGSDGFSGITANPLLGVFSDFLISQGGTSILTEVPEMFGAETLLMNRAENAAIFNKTVHLINDFKNYFIKNNQPVYENPSPGNKAGGISTLEEKSLGCTQKCGKATVKDVLMYGDRISIKGLNLLSAPGNDLVAATTLGAAGCQMVLFTTGRGTPFGSFVPTMKISTNSELYKNKPHWIDFNAGEIVETRSITDVCEDFIKYVIEVASGKKVNNEIKGYREISIFKTGVTL
jgi:altronate hydrolase